MRLAGWCEKQAVQTGLENFKGVKRRKEFKGHYKNNSKDCLFYDDYAHHPTELKALLSSMKEEFKNRRLITLFQPHRYTRFKNCWRVFLESFVDTDLLYVLPVYSAGENPIIKINSQNFVKKVKHSKAYFIKEEQVSSSLAKTIKKGDLILTVGAGSIYRYGEELFSTLQKSKSS